MLHRRLVIAIAASTLVLAGVASSAGTPAPSFLPAKIYPAGRTVRAVAVGDLNGDRKPDLATANHDSDSVSVLLNAGRGSFRTHRDYLVAASPWSIAVADLNADGKLDVVTASSSAAAVSVLLNKGNGTFEPRRNYPTGADPLAVAVGDLDGDGDPDLVTANSDFPGHVSVLLNTGDGSFADNREFVTGDAPESIVVRDLNGDGSQDVATAGSSAVSILLNAGGGILRSPHDISTGANLSSIAVGDLNGDGKPDLATVSYASDRLSVLLNRGGGRFGVRDYRTVLGPTSVAIGDLNADRRVDIAVLNEEADRFGARESWRWHPRGRPRVPEQPAESVFAGSVDRHRRRQQRRQERPRHGERDHEQRVRPPEPAGTLHRPGRERADAVGRTAQALARELSRRVGSSRALEVRPARPRRLATARFRLRAAEGHARHPRH